MKGKGVQKRSNPNGLNFYRKEFFSAHKDDSMNFNERNAALLQSWRKLPAAERERYNRIATEAKKAEVGGPTSSTVVTFHTRCSPTQFCGLAHFVKSKEILRERAERMGFGRLLDMPNVRIHRGLCEQLIRAVDPPTSTLFIRGVRSEIMADDVKMIMGLPREGEEVSMENYTEDLKTVKAELAGLRFSEIKQMIESGENDERFELLFLIYSMGTLLIPTSNGRVSEKILRVVLNQETRPRNFDWCSFVLKELINEIGEFKRGVEGSVGKSRNAGGCLYFLMV